MINYKLNLKDVYTEWPKQLTVKHISESSQAKRIQ